MPAKATTKATKPAAPVVANPYNAAYLAAIRAAAATSASINGDILVACHHFARAVSHTANTQKGA